MTGISEIWDIILDHRDKMTKSGELGINRKKQAVNWMWALVEDGLKERFYNNPDVKKLLPKITREVEKGIKAPTVAAGELLFFLDKGRSVYKNRD
jgi:LAO/AO transport system kinase